MKTLPAAVSSHFQHCYGSWRRLGFRLFSTHAGDRNRPESSLLFKPRRVAILSRITRYEFEKKRYREKNEEELQLTLERKRSDYQTLRERHETHYRCLEVMKQSLADHGIETRVQNRLTFTQDILDWADVIFTAGGDGTFLDAASKLQHGNKPVIGINTDPTRSEGRLCLPKEQYSASNFDAALKRLLAGDFKWKWRQRIRITMSGVHDNDDPVELHDQQMQHLEHRYTEHVREGEMCFRHRHVTGKETKPRVLPVRALNEVFVGESLSSRVSYYELSVDDKPGIKEKSSGVTVCTGTGSTSWYFHINSMPPCAVRDVLDIANKLSNSKFPTGDKKFIEEVTTEFNNSLKFDPRDSKMAFVVRDPLVNGVFQVPEPRGFAKKIQIRSRMWEANLVLDGGSSFKFNDGAIATLEIDDEDALLTVDFD